MNSALLLIGDGPFANYIAKKFAERNFSIIMTTIEEKNLDQIRSNGYIPIYASNLHEDGCQKIYEECTQIVNENSLALKYIIHTARCTYYEYDFKMENNHMIELKCREVPDDIRTEMFKVNGKSPEILAKLFYNLNCQFVYISSCASKGFPKSLSIHAEEKKNGKKTGTHGIKYYSYTKRLGEENAYNFYKSINKLSNLTIVNISVMLGTKFYSDMGTPDPMVTGFMSAEDTANAVVDSIFKGKKRIYPGWQAIAMKYAPTALNATILNAQKWFGQK